MSTFRGMSTIRFRADDLAAAARWYTDLLGTEPYFQQPGYVEFRIGDYQHELGIMDSGHPGAAGLSVTAPGGAVVYWAVDDLDAVLARLTELGAQEFEAKRDFGHGFVGAAVLDPFGNVLGVMTNPHYLEVLGGAAS